MFAKLPPVSKGPTRVQARTAQTPSAQGPVVSSNEVGSTSVTPFSFSQIPVLFPAERSGGPAFAATPAHGSLEAEADRLSQRTSANSAPGPAVPVAEPVSTPARQGLSSGKPLDAVTRARMESAFGHSFAEVRVHAGEEAARSARHLGARAFTAGPDVFFGRGEYRPQSSDGSRLLAHELTHVLQQRRAGLAPGSVIPVQRNVVPKDELRRMRDDIDVKLADPKLSEADRARLLKERFELSQSIGDEELGEDQPGDAPEPPHRARPTSGLPRSDPKLPLSHAPAATSNAPPPAKSRPKGLGSRDKSARASAKSEPKKSSVPPPTTDYINRDPQANADEVRVGRRLNELAMEGKLGSDVRRVEGRPRGDNRIGDYALILRGGSEVTADLYSPRSRGGAEDIARHAETKSGQAEVIVIELPGGAGPKTLELGHHVADALIANANTNLKRIIVVADNKLVLDRALNASGRALLRVQHRVQQRRSESTDPRPETAREAPDRVERVERGTFEVPDVRGVEGALGRAYARASAFEGAGQIILSWQFSTLQNPEIDKIYRRLEQLIPRIELLRHQGYQVDVWGKAEFPDVLDIAAGATDTRDASQVVYFVDLELVPRKLNVIPSSGPTMSGDPSLPRGGDPQKNFKEFARKGWHFVTALAFSYDPYLDYRR